MKKVLVLKLSKKNLILIYSIFLVFPFFGCAPRTQIVLMPDPGGKVGVLEVSTADGRQTLSKAWQATESGGIKKVPSEPAILDKEDVQKTFREALTAEPIPPVGFIIYFKSNSAVPLRESLSLLPKVLDAIQNRKYVDIIISGHTDTVGSSDYNHDLSLKRARNVANLLIARGIDRQIIQLTYHGKGNPLIPTRDGVSEPRNRRVEITVR